MCQSSKKNKIKIRDIYLLAGRQGSFTVICCIAFGCEHQVRSYKFLSYQLFFLRDFPDAIFIAGGLY
jgi:hypothetical protein